MPLLGFQETKNLLLQYKIPICQTEIVKSEKEAATRAKKIGYPVVLKIFSPKILHRSAIGGVKVGIKNEPEFKKAYSTLSRIKGVEGILVQKMILGREVALGIKRDPQFGPVLMFGLGGIFVEVLKDVSFRVCPISEKEALEMIKGIKGYKILKGYRGEKPVNIKALAKIIVNLSKLFLKETKIKEIDLNPVIVDKKRALACDFKILV